MSPSPTAHAPQPALEVTSETPRKRRRRWPYIVGAIVLTPVLAGGVYYAAQLGTGGDYVDGDGDFTHVTAESSISHVVGHPAFDGFTDTMRLFSSSFLGTITAPMAIDSIRSDAQAYADGANFVIDEVNAGIEVYRPLYGEAAIDADPSKAAAGLFFFPGDPGAPVAVVMPGGAFLSLATTVEGFPYAEKLHEQGYNVVVLHYRVGVQDGDAEGDVAVRAERAQEDLLAAMTAIAENPEWGLSPEDHSVWGSSAGGTLALLWGTDSELGASANGFPQPSAIVTAYPAVLGWPGASESYPPLFVTAAEDDELLAISTTDQLVADVDSAGVPVEYDRVATGGHGYGVANGLEADGWVERAISFWKAQSAR
ncbi:alpha/beta hydrolase [Microbacter sp. GSS18]|nr:alpha/beta hydrolase [Microbacter sp. GSS18]